jgi:hypothetical protein
MDKKYGTWGDLEHCLEMTDPYRENDASSPYRSKSEVIDVLAKFGSAKGFWWSIEFDGDDDNDESQTNKGSRRSISVDIHKGHAPDDDEPSALGRREDIEDENFYPVVD